MSIGSGAELAFLIFLSSYSGSIRGTFSSSSGNVPGVNTVTDDELVLADSLGSPSTSMKPLTYDVVLDAGDLPVLIMLGADTSS